MASLKKSELKRVRSTGLISYPELTKVSDKVLMASGSRGGSMDQAGT